MRSALAALLMAGCAAAEHRVVLVISAGDDPAAEVARWLPGCRAVAVTARPGPMAKQDVEAACSRVPEGDG
jgi:hypothetical protein